MSIFQKVVFRDYKLTGSLFKSMEQTIKYKNFSLVGTTGNGKSTTGNTLAENEEAFETSDLGISCTLELSHYDNHSRKYRVIDTPGFGDNRLNEKQIDQVLCKLTEKVINWWGESTNQIDAFFLVQMATPRLSSLKKDIEHMKDLFGTVSLKSVVILVIETNVKKTKTDDQFYEQITKMTEVIKILQDGKGSTFSKDWIIRWDNFNPFPNQLENALEAASKVEPYTHQKFLDAQEEIKQRMDKKIQEAIEIETKKLEERYQHDKNKLKEEVAKIEAAMGEEKKKYEQALATAVNYGQSIQKGMETMFNQQNKQFDKLISEMQASRAEEMRVMREDLSKLTQTQIEERKEYLSELKRMQEKSNQDIIAFVQKNEENLRQQREEMQDLYANERKANMDQMAKVQRDNAAAMEKIIQAVNNRPPQIIRTIERVERPKKSGCCIF